MKRVYQLAPAVKEKSNLWGHTWRIDEPICEIIQRVRDKQWQVSLQHDHTRSKVKTPLQCLVAGAEQGYRASERARTAAKIMGKA